MSERVRELISERELQARIREMGQQISRDYAGADLVMLGVLKGCFLFMADLCRHIDLPLCCDFVGLSSYGDRTSSSGVVRITADLTRPLEGKDVLIVEDIVDTGLTMQYLLGKLQDRVPRSIKLCSLLYKPARCVVPCKIDYLGFTVDDVFVIGYGLDFEGRYRNQRYIGVLDPDGD
ncbi:MAG: hypoxanthine phosphoribosyltransferase [Deltaproteobacteria bacterium]|nr:hypoxanthine phosphoribosyltransferase [Deltaproteobacteria bacterium]